jgi:hypothetical protein
LPEGLGNGFNAMMALAILKTIAFVTGEHRFQDAYLYFWSEENFGLYVDQTLMFSYLGPFTNWSVINMAYSSIYPLLRFEADPAIHAYWQEVLERDLWHSYFPGWEIASGGNAFAELIYGAFAPGGISQEAVDMTILDLSGFPKPPFWQRETVNCDEAEIEAGVCIGVDGETVLELAGIYLGNKFIPYLGHLDTLQTFEPVPWQVRPATNYFWRSSPHKVNGEYSDRLNPGGDFHGIYWLGRYMRKTEYPAGNISSHAM